MSWNMSSFDAAFEDFVLDQVAVHFDMFGSLMKNRVSCYVNCSLIITVKVNSLWMRNRKVRDKLSKPSELFGNGGHGTIFYFSKRLRDNNLLFRLPRDERVTQEYVISNDRLRCVRARGPVRVTITFTVK